MKATKAAKKRKSMPFGSRKRCSPLWFNWLRSSPGSAQLSKRSSLRYRPRCKHKTADRPTVPWRSWLSAGGTHVGTSSSICREARRPWRRGATMLYATISFALNLHVTPNPYFSMQLPLLFNIWFIVFQHITNIWFKENKLVDELLIYSLATSYSPQS